MYDIRSFFDSKRSFKFIYKTKIFFYGVIIFFIHIKASVTIRTLYSPNFRHGSSVSVVNIIRNDFYYIILIFNPAVIKLTADLLVLNSSKYSSYNILCDQDFFVRLFIVDLYIYIIWTFMLCFTTLLVFEKFCLVKFWWIFFYHHIIWPASFSWTIYRRQVKINFFT